VPWFGIAFVGLASAFAGWSGWVFFDRVINTDDSGTNSNGGTSGSDEGASSTVEATGNSTSSANDGLTPSTPVALADAVTSLAETNDFTRTTTTDRFLSVGQVDSITLTISDANGFSVSSIIEEIEKEAADVDGLSLRPFDKSTVTSTVTGVTTHKFKANIYTELEVTISGKVKTPEYDWDYGYHETFFTMNDDDGHYAWIGYEYEVA
jgi:hypothetical protein